MQPKQISRLWKAAPIPAGYAMSKRCVNPSRGRKQSLFVLLHRNYRAPRANVRRTQRFWAWFYRRGFEANVVAIFIPTTNFAPTDLPIASFVIFERCRAIVIILEQRWVKFSYNFN